jgi:hypothetical protein
MTSSAAPSRLFALEECCPGDRGVTGVVCLVLLGLEQICRHWRFGVDSLGCGDHLSAPAGYVLGLKGLALLRGWAGDFDETFTRDRLVTVRSLLEDPVLKSHAGVPVNIASVADGYQQWAATYEEPNGLFEFDEPFVHDILDGLRPGVALDAACGTGRFSEELARRGH